MFGASRNYVLHLSLICICFWSKQIVFFTPTLSVISQTAQVTQWALSCANFDFCIFMC